LKLHEKKMHGARGTVLRMSLRQIKNILRTAAIDGGEGATLEEVEKWQRHSGVIPGQAMQQHGFAGEEWLLCGEGEGRGMADGSVELILDEWADSATASWVSWA
jgi:hypothetical protein